MAEILKPFDLVAIQEVNSDLSAIYAVMEFLPSHGIIFTDIAGNKERLCYIFKKSKIKLTSHVGELDIPPSDRRHYKMTFHDDNGDPCIHRFSGFDRNPYVISWKFKEHTFSTYNCHIYFGDEKEDDVLKFRRRILEIFSLVKWVTSKTNHKNGFVFSPNVMLLGDMNVPAMTKDDEVFKQINNKTFTAVDYTDYLTPYSNIKNDKTYDQLVIAKPFAEKMLLKTHGIFAWDNAMFNELWLDLKERFGKKAASKFQAYAKWAISDHRPLWCLFEFD
ncbi:hypothetical protein [Nitrosopumilus ureiphilus]|uniref:Endonuclease/exonuclease/phosphatase domain-containing protein n=1 Tax=Nitrosopumilus ureiphilus TaxID=1470067 RepID=A0A7D5RCL3_9ARCH|nr:hypothetical protein [Nitrosopumilus ureiphilus]QLH06041.1 hypothetical protein C5F50_02315 [Nitrosopumilus ureiphilus]